MNRSLLTSAGAIGLATLVLANVAAGQVLHHWRFSGDDALVQDEVGDVDLRIVGNPAPFATGLPHDDRGAHFPTSFEGIGANNTGAMFGTGTGGFQTDEMTLITSDFLVESMVNLSDFSSSGATVHIAAQATPSLSDFAWSFHIRSRTQSGRGHAGELALVPRHGSTFGWLRSGIIIPEDTDYYLSSNLNFEHNEATFHAYDFADQSLRITSVPYSLPGMNTTSTLLIGDIPLNWRNHRTHGVIDEVRISNGNFDYATSLLGVAQFDDGQPTQFNSIMLGPRGVDRISDGRVRDQRAVSTALVHDGRDLATKFDLPDFIDVTELKSAKLRFAVSKALNDTTPLALLHSVTDNQFDDEFSEEINASYVETGLDLFTSGDSVGEYLELDVSDLIRQEYAGDGIASFRLRTTGEGRYRLAMQRDMELQPWLVLSFEDATAGELAGDIDGDGKVDFPDFLILSNNFGKAATAAQGDLDDDGRVDFPDFLILADNYGATAAANAAAVPEPASAILFLPGLLALLSRRRRHR